MKIDYKKDKKEPCFLQELLIFYSKFDRPDFLIKCIIRESITAITDDKTMPDSSIDPNWMDKPDRPAINITLVKIRLSDLE